MPEKNQNNSFLFKVNLGGMIDILSNHLYSSPDVYIRELLQNGVDAIYAKKPLKNDENNIEIKIMKKADKPVLYFTDTGTGLTEGQIHRFLAVIGQSSKYNAADKKESEDYIGRFGIGLLSCFLVSDKIIVRTCSIENPDISYEWIGYPDGTYTISEYEKIDKCGTTIVLEPKKDMEKYFSTDKITELVQYYGLPLPVPVFLNVDGVRILLNPPFPSGKECGRQVMALGKTLFKTEFIDYIPLESPSGLFSGVAYILADEVAPTVKQMHRIYLKNMLLTEDGSRLLPKWSFFLRFFINTDKLRPTASREDFYEDEVLITARKELLDCITAYLKKLSVSNSALLQKIVRIHNLAVESVAVEDDSLYRAFFPYFTFETSYGMITGNELIKYNDEIVYAAYVDEFRQVSAVFLAKGIMLVNAGYTYVKLLIERLYLLNEDASVIPLQMSRMENMLSDPTDIGSQSNQQFIELCRQTLMEYDCDVSLKCFEPDELPVLYTSDDNALIMRDIKHSLENANDLFSDMLNSFADEYKNNASAILYINANNPLIRRLVSVSDPEHLRCCIEILYVQSLLTGGYAMHNNELSVLNENLLTLLDWSI